MTTFFPMEIRIGIIGLGTVGAGVTALLQEQRSFFARELGFTFTVTAACAREEATLQRWAAAWEAGSGNAEGGSGGGKAQGAPAKAAPGPGSRPAPFLTREALDLVRRDDVDIVLELAGGYEKPREWITAALQHKKHVITANKALLAKHGAELFPLAAENGCFLLFEAAVGGGIPIIRSLQESLIANDIRGLACIINGTCNFILSEMTQKKIPFSEALKRAQEKGYAEADPAFDVEGIDSAHKVALLASLSYGRYVDFARMHVEGITRISPLDIEMADELGFVVKLIGEVGVAEAPETPGDGKAAEGAGLSGTGHPGADPLGAQAIRASVYPALLEKSHLLASVNGVLNAVFLKTSAVGPLLFTGAGAGRLPTASAVVSDLVSLARQLSTGSPRPLPMGFFRTANAAALAPIDTLETEFYLRLTTVDKPGVLAQVTAILSEAGISIRAILQKPEHDPERVPVILLTHRVSNAKVMEALKRIDALDAIGAPTQVLRYYR